MVRSTSILPRVRWSLSAVLVSVVCAQAALAGPDWMEGPDAGGLPPTSKALASSTSTQVRKVTGSTSVAALTGDGDRVDMFLVRTGTNTAEFKWIGPTWGARLTLFKKATGICTSTGTTVTRGLPIVTVVKASSTEARPILNGSAQVLNETGTAAGVLATYLVANSDYYVAISSDANIPKATKDLCGFFGEKQVWNSDTTSLTGQILAREEYRNSYRITRWLDPTSDPAGAYSMEVFGTFTVPASTCRDVADVVGSPAQRLFDFNYAPAVPAGTPNVPCSDWPVTRQFFYTWSPQCSGSAVVTTCGLTNAYMDTAIEVFVVDACLGDTCAAAATEPIACNDQCGTGNSSRVTFTATAGATYLVRLTRLWPGGTQQTGTIEFECRPPEPSADLNGDGLVDGADLAVLFGRWGTSGN